MPKLNLEAKNETQKIIKDYLEKNVSDILADKINNGVRIQKDGKTLINKKTLAGCMDFALKEAQKLTEKAHALLAFRTALFSAGLSTFSRKIPSKARSITKTARNTNRQNRLRRQSLSRFIPRRNRSQSRH